MEVKMQTKHEPWMLSARWVITKNNGRLGGRWVLTDMQESREWLFPNEADLLNFLDEIR